MANSGIGLSFRGKRLPNDGRVGGAQAANQVGLSLSDSSSSLYVSITLSTPIEGAAVDDRMRS